MNWKRTFVGLGLVLALGVGTAFAQDATEAPAMQQGATAALQDASGGSVGQVTFSENSDGKVVILASITGMNASGFMGFHIHEAGQCDATGGAPFASAGAYFNPSGAKHPDEAGDLPPLLVNDDGTAQLMLTTDRFKLADLFDVDGSAIVIDSGADNFANIPQRYGQADADTLQSGDSGARIACGVITEDSVMTAG